VVEGGKQLVPPSVQGAGQPGQLGDVRGGAVGEWPVQQLLRPRPVGGR